METINERFRATRKALSKNQAEWGEILGITRAGVSDIESGRRKVTDKHIKLLCSNPISGRYIDEKYLRTGEADMFKKLEEDDEVALYVSELLEDGGENPMYDLIKEIMRTYSELSPESQQVMCEFSEELMENIKRRKD